ncbi:Rrg8p LALA0_S01e14180g [Lachancea lanzarotensis]|uniref:Required for respiratory growth protein 8, mitochondrial n=1 Tax=Lachancea lanzarotensis TaxID=1245769 RepID=A0A0C7MTE7_9SACH|nr:uncharacterized protein LALA0_S01e14180g [Lachancea lanzarotensis]CEP60581.1 LALA0S01e14180g1_1 [Lachancea lanzarotensis]
MKQSKPDVLIHSMEMLISGKARRIAPKPNCKVSPVIERFDKWAGKPRKLYFRDASKVPRTSICLQNNMFASILASPMRLDRITRLHSPKDLLTQVKLVDEANKDKQKPFVLDIAVPARKKGPTSYINNRNALLVKNQASTSKWVPTSSLNTAIRNINFKDIGQPKEFPTAQIVRSKLLKQVREGLSQLLDTNDDGSCSPTNCNIKVISDFSVHARIQIAADGCTIINLASIDDKFLQDLLREKPDDFIAIKYSTQKQLCIALYNLLIHTE